MNLRSQPAYLGDGLFAEYNGYQIELYASDGETKTNTVYLEPHVLINFLAYVKRIKGEGNETQSKV